MQVVAVWYRGSEVFIKKFRQTLTNTFDRFVNFNFSDDKTLLRNSKVKAFIESNSFNYSSFIHSLGH